MESDWPRRNKSHYVTEIVSWLGFADVIFGGDKRQPEICLCSQATYGEQNGISVIINFFFFMIGDFPNTQAVAYTTYFELGKPAVDFKP